MLHTSVVVEVPAKLCVFHFTLAFLTSKECGYTWVGFQVVFLSIFRGVLNADRKDDVRVDGRVSSEGE